MLIIATINNFTSNIKINALNKRYTLQKQVSCPRNSTFDANVNMFSFVRTNCKLIILYSYNQFNYGQ